MGRSERPVAVVTGGSRGAGRGIAVALGEQGYRVYVTGRTVREGDADLPGTIGATAAQVDAAGGEGVAVQCDHADDAQVAALFARAPTNAADDWISSSTTSRPCTTTW